MLDRQRAVHQRCLPADHLQLQRRVDGADADRLQRGALVQRLRVVELELGVDDVAVLLESGGGSHRSCIDGLPDARDTPQVGFQGGQVCLGRGGQLVVTGQQRGLGPWKHPVDGPLVASSADFAARLPLSSQR